LKVTVGAFLVHVVLAVTVKELVATIASPWLALVEAFQQLVVTVLEQLGWKYAPVASYLLPYQDTFQVYVPAAVGAGALSVMGKAGPLLGALDPEAMVPLLIATCCID
jgi:hypothetical protein